MKALLFALILLAACNTRHMGRVWYDSDGNVIKEKKNKHYKSPKATAKDSVYIKIIDSLINKGGNP